MPKINFCFQGWANDVEVSQCANTDGQLVDVTDLDSAELCRRLNAGELFLSLADHLNTAEGDEEIEIHDFSEGI